MTTPDLVTFYINRDVDLSRREQIARHLEAANMPAERISAVNGYDVPERLARYFPQSRLKAGEVGCYASHMLAWEAIHSRALPYALVLEDDAAFAPSAKDALVELLGKLPQGWDYIHLDGRLRPRAFASRPISALSDNRQLVRYGRIPDGTVAQLVSLQGARKLLRDTPRIRPVDTDIRMPWLWDLDVYGVTPSPFGHADFDSAIKTLGGNSRKRSWKGSGFRSAHSFLFNLRKLGPVWWLKCAKDMSLQKLSRRRAGKRLPADQH